MLLLNTKIKSLASYKENVQESVLILFLYLWSNPSRIDKVDFDFFESIA